MHTQKEQIFHTYMLVPITHALPTKVMATLRARHVITTAILFNAIAALGTLFGMNQHPIGRFRLVLTFLLPPFEQGARDECLVPVSARQAKTGATSGALSR